MDSNYSNTYILMFGNTEVMRFSFGNFIYKVLNEKFMPYILKGQIIDFVKGSYSFEKAMELCDSNKNAIVNWLSSRVLLLSRKNAKKIYDTLGMDQSDDKYTKARIALMCRAVSVLDNYWLKIDGESLDWDSVNIRINKLNEMVAQVALHGDSITFAGSYDSPEYTTHGLYAKAWRRHDDTSLWLHKLDSNVEAEVSSILDKCNVSHIKYILGMDDGETVSMCKCMTDDKVSVVSAYEYRLYCSHFGLDFIDETLRIDGDSFYKMCIVDYLISNDDRHARNWGFYVSNRDMSIMSMHPLFDHNNAFSEKCMRNDKFENRVVRQPANSYAKYAMGETDFHFTSNIIRGDFTSDEHYDSFMRRAEELSIRTVKDSSVNSVIICSAGGIIL